MSTENQKIDIILDCDPGYDDAAAILLAAGNPNVNILAITVVAGNRAGGGPSRRSHRGGRHASPDDRARSGGRNPRRDGP